MKNIQSGNFVNNNTEFESYQFGIKSKNLSHIIHILRDQIYSDKILAIIRETCTNAADANVDNGKGNIPITVTLPTKLDPVFKVRDNGKGLSKEEVIDIFISYGESTKRNSNNTVGMLGIGAKSPFAYGSNFLVTSYNNGVKTVYDCVLDSSNVGSCLLLTSEPMGKGDVEGIEITVPVKMDDVNYFVEKAINFFNYWDTKPIFVNYVEKAKMEGDNSKKVLFEGKDGDWVLYGNKREGYYTRGNESIALMGNIPYPIKWENVRFGENNSGNKILNVIKNNGFLIKFKIGDVQFAPSREALQYTELTNDSIVRVCNKVFNEIESVVQNRFLNCKSLMEALSLYREVFEDYYAPLHYLSGEIKVTWNNYPIISSNIEGVNQLDAHKGYSEKAYDGNYAPTAPWTPVMDCYEKLHSGNVRMNNGSRYECRRIECKSSSKLLLLDMDKITLIRKAVKYLMSLNNEIRKVYVFKFYTDKAKKDAYKHLQLDHLDMVKYSSIINEVKKTVIRSSKSANNFVKLNKNEISTKYFEIKPDYFRWSSSILTTDIVSVNKHKGYYIKCNRVGFGMVNNKELKMDVLTNEVNSIVCLANKLMNMDITKIYCFGPRIYNNKNINLKNFICIDKLIGELCAVISKNVKLKMLSAYSNVSKATDVNNNSYGDYYKLINKVSTSKLVTNSDSVFYKLNDIFETYHIKNLNDYTSKDEDMQLLKMLNKCGLIMNAKIDCKTETVRLENYYKSIYEKYPMLIELLHEGGNYYICSEESARTKMLCEYINIVDGSIGKKALTKNI